MTKQNKAENIFSIRDKVGIKDGYKCFVASEFKNRELFIYNNKLIANNELMVSTKNSKLITSIPYKMLHKLD